MSRTEVLHWIEEHDTEVRADVRRTYRDVRTQDAEDILHDAYVRVLKRADTLEVGPQFRHYLYANIRGARLDLARKFGRQPMMVEIDPWLAGEDGIEEQVMARIDLDALLPRLSNLPAKYQSVLIPKILGYTKTEVAAMLGLPVGTVATRWRTGLALLRKEAA